jgi:Trk-type K+ transport system membrane component
MTLLGSLLIYTDRTISYVDALFFAAGACTQAGLNTVDVNLLTTWQQVWIFLSWLIA